MLYYIGADDYISPKNNIGPANRSVGVATSTDTVNWKKYGNAPVLNGTSDFSQIDNNDHLHKVFSRSFTVTSWVLPENIPPDATNSNQAYAVKPSYKRKTRRWVTTGLRRFSSVPDAFSNMKKYYMKYRIGVHDPFFDFEKNCFKGYLDEIRIYDRALSSSEIYEIYTLGWVPDA